MEALGSDAGGFYGVAALPPRFRERSLGLRHTASTFSSTSVGELIANSYDPSDTSEGFCCIRTFRFGFGDHSLS